MVIILYLELLKEPGKIIDVYSLRRGLTIGKITNPLIRKRQGLRFTGLPTVTGLLGHTLRSKLGVFL